VKRLDLHSLGVDDYTILSDMCANASLSSHPLLAQHKQQVKRAFRRYQAKKGRRLGAPPVIPLELGEALQTHYSGPISVLGFIAEIRAKLSPDVCPCCGAGSSSTVDHVLPQGVWKVYSTFSWNLVPACDQCNRNKGAQYVGANDNQRPIHPYFDNFLKSRVALATIEPPYDTPTLQIVVAPGLQAAVAETVEWHLATVVRKTSICETLTERWLNACRDPVTAYPSLKYGATVEQGVADKLQMLDKQFGTPNNWESMLQAGIAADAGARAFLQACRTKPLEGK
jgi:hypothetical protein